MKLNQIYYKSSTKMSELDDESVHLIITSPPYFNIKDYSQNGTNKEQDLGNIADYNVFI